MTRNTKSWLWASGVLLLFILLAWLLGWILGVQGGGAWIFRGSLIFLGLVAAVLVFFFIRRRGGGEAEAEGGGREDDELASVVSMARSRLAASAATTTSKLGKLPVMLVLGPSGSTKTSVVVHSGMDPELLAGEVHRGEAVIPTEAANIWFAQSTIVLEAGGKLMNEPPRWQRLIRYIQPSRLGAALGRGAQAPRIAVVCFACDELLKPGASEGVVTAARKLRARLAEVAQQLGIRLPVYVLFTKADRLPYFEDYVRNFSGSEAQEVLGATLPAMVPGGSGTFAEREAQRLQDALKGIFHSLALRRLEVLQRESREDVKAGAYEFPRELRKVSELATQFMLDLCKPSQLSVSPFLRGFYFAGVRPIVITDSAATPTAPSGPAAAAAMGATSVFNPRMLQEMQQTPQPGLGSRKVPEWVFLKRLFRDVILADRAAMGVTAGGTRLNLLRRGLITAAAAAGLVLAVGFTVSYAKNRSLESQAVAAARGVQDLGSVGNDAVTQAGLRQLDALRAVTARVTTYERNGRPLSMAWGLYTGSRLQPDLYHLYFDRFRKVLWGRTQEQILTFLRGLPEQPNEASEYRTVRDALAAYLVTTSEPQRATPEFLTPVALQYLARAARPDSASLLLAGQQFDFYASVLPWRNPYDTPANDSIVHHTQAFLNQFGSEQTFYQALVAEANNAIPGVQYVGPAMLVTDPVAVPGAFTRPGWDYVQAHLDSVDQVLARDSWVLGQQASLPADRARLREDLRQLYEQEYVRRWQDYLSKAAVQRFRDVPDAASKLSLLGRPDSPLLAMLALASRQTNLDSTTVVGKAFQPVHVVVAPNADDRNVAGSAQNYIIALSTLQAQLGLLGSASGSARDQALVQTSGAATGVKQAVGQLAAGFSLSGEAATTAVTVQRLLQQPADFTEGVIRGLPTADLNQGGQSFCSQYGVLAGKYPFDPQGSGEASMDDVGGIFRPNDGVLWSFYQSVLQNLLTRQGSPKPGATPRPSRSFATFFGRAAAFSGALYDQSGAGPSVVFELQPEIPAGATEIVVDVDGQQGTFTPTIRPSKTFSWDGGRANQVRVVARMNGASVTLDEEKGPWAVFRLFQKGSWTGNGPYQVTWRFPQTSLTAQVSFEAGTPPVFRPGYLAPLRRCVSRIAG